MAANTWRILCVMRNGSVWTLAQAARLLGEPQHRLIYLCEKQGVVPDVADAAGRGSSRRFSSRNLLQFAVALRLKTLGLPAKTTAIIVYALRAFERRVLSARPGADLLQTLRRPDGIELRAIVADGRLYFFLRQGDDLGLVFGGVPLAKAVRANITALKSKMRAHCPAIILPDSASFGGPEGSRYVRLDININEIARGLRLEQ
jgi:hypothetical protein